MARADGLEVRKAWKTRIIPYEDIRRCELDRDDGALVNHPRKIELVVDTRHHGILRFRGVRWRPDELRELGLFIRAKLRRLPARCERRAEARGGDEQ